MERNWAEFNIKSTLDSERVRVHVIEFDKIDC